MSEPVSTTTDPGITWEEAVAIAVLAMLELAD